jgi:predicted nuclease with TOPRIM domain
MYCNRKATAVRIAGDSDLFHLARRSQDLASEDDATMANPKADMIEERLDRLEQKVSGLDQRVGGLEQKISRLDETVGRLSERVYGVEDRIDTLTTRLDVGFDAVRNDIKLTLERVDGLREHIDRSREDDRRERAADKDMLFALVRDHNRRLRAIERLERRRSSSN